MLIDALLSIVAPTATESDLRRALHNARWPDGFRCPKCNHHKGYQRKKRPVIECASRACKYQASVTAGTEFHKTRTKLQTWVEIAQLKKSAREFDSAAVAKKYAICAQTVNAILTKIGAPSDKSKTLSATTRELLLSVDDASAATTLDASQDNPAPCCCRHIRSILFALRDIVRNYIRAPASSVRN